MSITIFELKKVIRNPIVWIVLIGVVFLDIFTILVGGSQYEYSANAAAFQTNIAQIQENGAYFAGAMTDEWAERYIAEAEAIRNDPANRVSEDEAVQIKQKLLDQGFAEDYIEDYLGFYFVREDVIRSNEYQRYEDVEFSAQFYDRAAEMSEYLSQYYRDAYPGAKGEALAAKAEDLYDYLAGEYTAYYNYDYGYQKVRNMMTLYPLTIGLLVLVALSSIFSSEYSKRTDALILTSKHGKRRLIYSKFKAGLLVSFFAWLLITVMNLILIFSLYGATGWEAYWQNWLVDWAPFAWSQGQITIVSMATGLLGVLFFSFIIMFISSFSKSPFISIIAGAVILLFPMFDFAFTNNSVVNTVYSFLPTRVLMGITIWQGFDLAYLFGKAIPIQYVIIVSAVILSLCTMPIAYSCFRNHQVEN